MAQAHRRARRVPDQRRLHAAPAGRHHRAGHSAVELAADGLLLTLFLGFCQAARRNDADGGRGQRAPARARTVFRSAARPVHHHHWRWFGGRLCAVQHGGSGNRAHPRYGRPDLHAALVLYGLFRYLYLLHRQGGGGI